MQKQRVVITGMGLVSPLGVGVEPTWGKLIKGQSGIRRIDRFDPTDYAVQIAGQVPGADEEDGFNAEEFIGKKDMKKMSRFIQFGMKATDEALKMAGLEAVEDEELLKRIGVMLGSGVGGLEDIEKAVNTLQTRGPKRISPFYIPSILINMFSGQVSIKYGFKGPNSAVVTACATATHAIGDAFKILQRGDADIMIAGGAESAICPTSVAGFAAAKALSSGYNETPEKASRPFDKKRDGFVMGEGSGVVVLETLESAEKRGANIIAEIVGYGMAGDGYHMTSPHPDGVGAIGAMEAALKDAEVPAEDVKYVNGHATSTPAGDIIESQSVEKLLGKDTMVSATKSMTGHLLGAAGGIEAVFSIKALQDDILPPTINIEELDEGCNLDYIKDEARHMAVDYALSNSFGFGGTNASLLFKKFK
ncbi:MAG TPA: beta-ketoacyl-[acyl-carrier-protein] synthase II [Alphaproteobacteria bacterium]|nr:beta-ketoacyl-[acyl-carrier-protein] synthase II [Alphaproteobacteria bacterium]